MLLRSWNGYEQGSAASSVARTWGLILIDTLRLVVMPLVVGSLVGSPRSSLSPHLTIADGEHSLYPKCDKLEPKGRCNASMSVDGVAVPICIDGIIVDGEAEEASVSASSMQVAPGLAAPPATRLPLAPSGCD